MSTSIPDYVIAIEGMANSKLAAEVNIARGIVEAITMLKGEPERNEYAITQLEAYLRGMYVHPDDRS